MTAASIMIIQVMLVDVSFLEQTKCVPEEAGEQPSSQPSLHQSSSACSSAAIPAQGHLPPPALLLHGSCSLQAALPLFLPLPLMTGGQEAHEVSLAGRHASRHSFPSAWSHTSLPTQLLLLLDLPASLKHQCGGLLHIEQQADGQRSKLRDGQRSKLRDGQRRMGSAVS